MKVKPVIRKTRSRRRHLIKPVNKLLGHIINILYILIDGHKGTNKIFDDLKKIKQKDLNFSYKYDIIDSVYHMKKNYLIRQSSHINHKQLKELELTELGHEIADLIYNIHEFNKHYREVKDSISRYFDIQKEGDAGVSERIARHRLKEKGWSGQDIEKFNLWLDDVFRFEYDISLSIINALMARYTKILHKYDVTKVAKDILTHVILKAITDQISLRLEGMLIDKYWQGPYKEGDENKYQSTFEQFAEPVLTCLINHASSDSLNKFNEKESLRLMRSLYNVLSPNEEYSIRSIEQWRKVDPRRTEQVLSFIKNLKKTD